MTPAPWIVSDELWALVEPVLLGKQRRRLDEWLPCLLPSAQDAIVKRVLSVRR